MSNFSFCHNVFRSRLLQRCQKASVCGKGFVKYIVSLDIFEINWFIILKIAEALIDASASDHFLKHHSCSKVFKSILILFHCEGFNTFCLDAIQEVFKFVSQICRYLLCEKDLKTSFSQKSLSKWTSLFCSRRF